MLRQLGRVLRGENGGGGEIGVKDPYESDVIESDI